MMNKFTLLSLIAILSLSLFYSCEEEDPETIVETRTINTTDTLIVRDTIVRIDTISNFILDTGTTFILVRHAETDANSGGGLDPILSNQGTIRANLLKDILQKVPLSAIYSTNFVRTKKTVEPTSIDQSIPIQIYDGFNLDPFIDSALIKYNKGIILVSGHTSITPSTLNILVGSNQFPDIPSTDYGNLYIATVAEKGNATVLNLWY